MISHDKNIFKQNKPVLIMRNKKVNNAFFPRNRKGQELSTNAIIMIVIGIIVLVVLVLGFTIGWNRLLPFVSSNNIENIKTGCSTACSTNNVYDYCALPRNVNDGVNDKFTESCYNLTAKTEYAPRNYGIGACPAISSSCQPQISN